MWLPLIGLALGVALGLVLNVNVSPDLARYSAVAILAGLDSVLGAIRAELDAHYDNRIFISGFITNTLVAVALTFVVPASMPTRTASRSKLPPACRAPRRAPGAVRAYRKWRRMSATFWKMRRPNANSATR